MDHEGGKIAAVPTDSEPSALNATPLKKGEEPPAAAGDSADDGSQTHSSAVHEAFEGLSDEDIETIDINEDAEEVTFGDTEFDWEDEEIPGYGKRKRLKRWVIAVAIIIAGLCLLLFVLWLFFPKYPSLPLSNMLNIFGQRQETEKPEEPFASPVKQEIKMGASNEKPEVPGGSDQNQAKQQDPSINASGSETSFETEFRPKLAEMSRFRNELLEKQQEIRDLQQIYRKRIAAVTKEILEEKKRSKVKNFSEAKNIKHIEYGLRTIQRRKIYISNLSIPLGQLQFASEELLYLERLSHIQMKMRPVVKGVDVEELKAKIDRALQKHRDGLDRLTVQTDNLPALDLKATWNEVLRERKKEARSPKGNHDKKLPQEEVKTNSLILEEILKGKFSRKGELTWLSPEGADALSKLKGETLFLNRLTDLHPSTAEKLARWQGNWLCLNGIKEISPETAEVLAQWPGKRLSLNGLRFISDRAARELSKWQGMELEMVGLTDASLTAVNHLKNWEHSGKKIYFSKEFNK